MLLMLRRTFNFDRMAGYWSEVLKVRRNMSNIYLTREADGTSLIVANLPGRGLTIQEQRPGRKKGETDVFNYRPQDYPRRALSRVADVVRGRPGLDQRAWAWYHAARNAKRSVWVNT